MFAWGADAIAQPLRTALNSIPPNALRETPSGELPATQNLRFALSLPLRNQVALTARLQALYDPANPDFHHWLTAKEFTEQFGPSEADVAKVTRFAQKYKLCVEKIFSNRMVVDLSAPVSDIEQAFNVRMVWRKHPTENRNYFAPDVQPSVEAGVPALDVSGLDDFAVLRSKYRLQAVSVNGKMKRVTNSEATVVTEATGSSPGGGYMGNDLRAAYAPGVTLDGTGQAIGIVVLGAVCYSNDLAAYCATSGIPPILFTNVLLDGVTGVPSGDVGEQSLDAEVSHALAPGARTCFYVGNNPIDVFNAIASDNICKSASSSVGVSPPPGTLSTTLQQMAAQGQSMFNACGDSGFGSPFGWDDNPYITQVGGTVLSTEYPGGPRTTEDGWSGSGGNISPNFSIPSWQQGINMLTNGGSITQRNCPDVAMVSDNLYFCYNDGASGLVGGTSASSPEWAGFMALVNQQAAARGDSTVGFINPVIYGILKGSNSFSYSATFNDITTGSNGKTAVPGYDLVTGLGTPRGQSLIDALARGTNIMPDYFLSSSPTLFVIQENNSTNTISINSLGNFSDAVNLAISGLPSGVTASFNPAGANGGSALILSASGSATPGTVAAKITGISGSLSHFILVNVTVINPNASLNLGFESPVVSDHQYNLTNGGWNFFGNGAGILANGSAFGNPSAPQGTQAAFLQSYGIISQSMAIFIPGVTYTITFAAAQRGSVNGSGESWNVMIDNAVIAGFNPGESATSYQDYSVLFTATNQIHTLAFVGTDVGTGDNTVFIDNVRIAPTASPDFSLTTPTGELILGDGSNISSAITVNSFNGFSSNVNLFVSGLPPGIVASFNPSTGADLASSTLTLTAGAFVVPGFYQITVNGVSGDVLRTSTVNLLVLGSKNFGFETPTVADHQYNPSGAIWTFSGTSPSGSGIVANGSAFGNPSAPEGVQAAFVEEYGSISQTFNGFIPGAKYSITVAAAERVYNGQTNTQVVDIKLDNTLIGTLNPTGTNAAIYRDYATNFTPSSATGALSIVGTDPAGGDNTLFLDNIRINVISNSLAAPTGLVATVSNSQTILGWNASPGATSYNVKRSTINGGPYSTVANVTTPAYIDNPDGVYYYYVVSAVNSAGESSNSVQTPSSPIIVNNFGFEAPAISDHQYNPSGASWNFTGASPSGSGIAANNSAFSNPNAPQGVQAAFVQEDGSISQSLSGFVPGSLYSVTFSAAQRPGSNQHGGESWNVKLDNTVIGSFNPGSGATIYMDYVASFTPTATTHTLSFVGTDLAGGDNTVFLDNVRISVVSNAITPPEGLVAAPGDMQANLAWDASPTATNYYVKRSNNSAGPYLPVGSTAGTSYTDSGLTNGLIYYYVVSALNQIGESANSAPVDASPVSTNPVSITWLWTNNTLTLYWPLDHTGWQLQAQTNPPTLGLGTNWLNIPGTTTTNQFSAPIGPLNGSIFYRLVYQ